MLFCPTCSNLLLTEQSDSEFRFYCKTCPYIQPIKEKVYVKMDLERKQVDDVMGGKESWKNVDQIEAKCPKCDHNRAFFMEL